MGWVLNPPHGSLVARVARTVVGWHAKPAPPAASDWRGGGLLRIWLANRARGGRPQGVWHFRPAHPWAPAVRVPDTGRWRGTATAAARARAAAASAPAHASRAPARRAG